MLREFYNAAAAEGKLEIVYVSSDKDLESFNEYVSCNHGNWRLCGVDVDEGGKDQSIEFG